MGAVGSDTRRRARTRCHSTSSARNNTVARKLIRLMERIAADPEFQPSYMILKSFLLNAVAPNRSTSRLDLTLKKWPL